MNWSNQSDEISGGVIGAIIQLGNCLDLTDLNEGFPMTEETRKALQVALVELRNKPHKERWQEMVDLGFIDEKGNVLLPSKAPSNRFQDGHRESEESRS